MSLSVIILAAGKGVRMKSDIPKVLHELAGKPLLEHVVNTAMTVNPANIYVVYGNGGEHVKERLKYLPVTWVEQKKQLGTAHAIHQVMPLLNPNHRVLVLYGDVPLISHKTLDHLLSRTPKDALGWLTEDVDDPTGLGRIIRDEDDNPMAIVEEKDASVLEKQIKEINTGICLVPVKYLHAWLPLIKNNNSQKEYYLTDIFGLAVEHGVNITTVSPNETYEIYGVNDNVQLANLERIWQKCRAVQYMEKGLTLLDPDRFDIRGELIFGKDITIDVNVIIDGRVKIGSRSYIGPNVILKNTEIGEDVRIESHTIIEDSKISTGCCVGPFARLRPGTFLCAKAKVGNFVEMKKTKLGEGSKVNHLSYVGDATVGKSVNIGAGTITCNYDGMHKHATKIGDDVFIGSNTSLVAPVSIGAKATIGAGSVITKNAPKEKLTLARSHQETKADWVRPKDRKE